MTDHAEQHNRPCISCCPRTCVMVPVVQCRLDTDGRNDGRLAHSSSKGCFVLKRHILPKVNLQFVPASAKKRGVGMNSSSPVNRSPVSYECDNMQHGWAAYNACAPSTSTRGCNSGHTDLASTPAACCSRQSAHTTARAATCLHSRHAGMPTMVWHAASNSRVVVPKAMLYRPLLPAMHWVLPLLHNPLTLRAQAPYRTCRPCQCKGTLLLSPPPCS